MQMTTGTWFLIMAACGLTGLALGRYLMLRRERMLYRLDPQYTIVLEPDVERIVEALELACEARDRGWPPQPSEN